MTLHLPPGSPVVGLPWVITIGGLGGDEDDDWDPVVCGPYERDHALALARAVVADDDLMAVVEPMMPLDGVEAIRAEIALARDPASGPDPEEADAAAAPVLEEAPEPAEVRAGWRRISERLTH